MWTPTLLLLAAVAATPPSEVPPDRALLEFLAEFALAEDDDAAGIDPLWLSTPDAASELDAAQPSEGNVPPKPTAGARPDADRSEAETNDEQPR
ncbi:MAG: hypothetical protein MUE46_02090 [Xanthomonadales bacterium]|jgi:hypothetical protein|nr:hypothetical protein [Xanthomonadales bacterium]